MIGTDDYDFILLIEHGRVVGNLDFIFFFNFFCVHQWVVEGGSVSCTQKIDIQVGYFGVTDVITVWLEREAQDENVGLCRNEVSYLAATLMLFALKVPWVSTDE